MGKITEAIKEVTQGARALEKVTDEVAGATKKAEQALQRTTRETSSTARSAERPAAKAAEPGRVGTAPKSSGKYPKTYNRPSGYRKGVRDAVWTNAERASKDSKVRDPLTGQVMAKDKPWDMGHKPGYEFRKHQESAAQREIDREQFLDEHNDPNHYWPELPSSNQSHRGEDHTSDYFGP